MNSVKQNKDINIADTTKILLQHCSTSDELTRKTSLVWLHELIILGGDDILEFAPQLIGALLPSLSVGSNDIKEEANRSNTVLLRLIKETKKEFDTKSVLNALTEVRNEYIYFHLIFSFYYLCLK